MKAVIMAVPAMDGSTTSVADIDEPQPGPGQVAIDVAYAGVNFIDVMARRGDPGYASAWPYVPGLEVAGTIRSAGAVMITAFISHLLVRCSSLPATCARHQARAAGPSRDAQAGW